MLSPKTMMINLRDPENGFRNNTGPRRMKYFTRRIRKYAHRRNCLGLGWNERKRTSTTAHVHAKKERTEKIYEISLCSKRKYVLYETLSKCSPHLGQFENIYTDVSVSVRTCNVRTVYYNSNIPTNILKMIDRRSIQRPTLFAFGPLCIIIRIIGFAKSSLW